MIQLLGDKTHTALIKHDTSTQCLTNGGANVVDSGPTLVEHWVDILCFCWEAPGRSQC